MGCGRCGKARQGPSCLSLLGKRVEAVPAKAFPPRNALPVCSRWWCQRSRSTGGAGQVFSTAQVPEEVRAGISSPAAAQECKHLQTAAGQGAVTLDAASQLWSHLTAWDWTSSSVDVPDDQKSVCHPSIFLPPLPLCLPAWDDSLMFSYSGPLWVTHSSCWWEQNKHSSKAQAGTKLRSIYAAEIFSI